MHLLAASLLMSNTLLATAPAVNPAQAIADHVTVTLLSEHDALVPGTRAWFGLRLQHDAHWHTYWINPGDSGLPTRLDWRLPEGFSAADIAWPVPKRFSVGALFNFGYDGDVVLPVPLEVPANATAGNAHVEVQARWLVCQEQCIPGKAMLALDLPLRTVSSATAAADAVAAARDAQPQHGAYKATARVVDDRIEVTLRGAELGDGRGVDALAFDGKVVANAPPRVKQRDGTVVLSFAKSDYYTSIPQALHLLVVPPGAPAFEVHAPFQNPS